jgi:hypothetical protein
MSVMRMFGLGNVTLTACSARLDVPDTDVIFVLDTTGSMACLPGDDGTTCNNYVNAAGTTTYSRPLDGATSGNTSVLGYPLSRLLRAGKSGSRISALRTAVLSFFDTLAAASEQLDPYPLWLCHLHLDGECRAGDHGSVAALYGGRRGQCQHQLDLQCAQPDAQPAGHSILYSYQPVSENLTTYVTGLPTLDPTKIGVTSSWAGCIEGVTTPGLSTFNINSLPYDLDPDLVPTSDIRTQWKPMWPEVFLARNNYTCTSNSATLLELGSSNPNIGTPYYLHLGYVTCGKPVARLSTMTRDAGLGLCQRRRFPAHRRHLSRYGDDLGHAAAFPTGMFAADTAPGRARPPNRVIVFLTDGLMAPSTCIYGMYGNEYYDKRVSGEISAIWPAITTCAFWPNAARPRRATSTSGPFRSPRWRPPR